MSGRVLRFDDPEHEAVEALLPWFVNGTLDVDECSLVERHLKDCTRCGYEADSLRQLKTAYGESGMVPDAAQSLHKLRRKLDKPRARRLLPRLFDLTRFGRQSWLWVHWVVAGELAVILVLGMLLVFSGRPTTLYQTLGAADVPRHVAGSLVVVFELTEPDRHCGCRDAEVLGHRGKRERSSFSARARASTNWRELGCAEKSGSMSTTPRWNATASVRARGRREPKRLMNSFSTRPRGIRRHAVK